MEITLLLIGLMLFPIQTHEFSSSKWIIWNVGQGEWVTEVLPDRCRHFDMGGEHWPKLTLRKTCGDRLNFVYFSHWDMDHVGLAQKVRHTLPKICLAKAPLGETSKRKRQMLKDWTPCPKEGVNIWEPPLDRKKKTSTNERSQIYREDHMLVTGDAPAAEENIFVHSQNHLRDVRWLVLGHHGSRTSTSEILLQSLPSLKLAIASARHGKYGHPHSEVLHRLRYYRIPVLSTEDWGNIEIDQ